METHRISGLKSWQVEQGVALSFSGRDVAAITSQLGALWVTQPGIMADYFLHAGERFEITPNARHIVVEAISPKAQLCVTSREPAPRVRPSFNFRVTLAQSLHRIANWIDAPHSTLKTC